MNKLDNKVPIVSYGVTLGIGVAIGLGSWMLGTPDDVFQSPILFLTILIGITVALIIDKVTKQRYMYIGDLVIYIIVSSLIILYLLNGAHANTLFIYVVLGTLFGGLPKLLIHNAKYEYILTIVALIIGTLLIEMHVLFIKPVTIILLWRTTSFAVTLLFLFSFLGSTTKHVTAFRIGAEYILFVAIWISPIIYYIDNQEATNLSPQVIGIIAVATLVYLIARNIVWKMLDRFWIFPIANRQMLTRQLQYLLKHPSASQIADLESAYQIADPAWRRLALKKTIHTDTLKGWETLILQQETFLREDALDALEESAINSDINLRTSILNLLRDGVLSGSAPLWKQCLERLVSLDTHRAQEVCKERAEAGDIAPIAAYLSMPHEISDYFSAVEMLLSVAHSVRKDERQRIADLITQYVDDENLEKSSTAIYAIVKLDVVDNVPRLFESKPKDYTTLWQIAMSYHPEALSRHVSEKFISNDAKYEHLLDRMTIRRKNWMSPNQKNGYAVAIETLCDAIFQGSSHTAQIGAHILAHNEVDTPWVYLADALVIDHLNNLLPLFTENLSEVREIAHKTIMLVVEQHPDLRERASDILSEALQIYDTSTSENLVILQRIDPDRIPLEVTKLVGKPLSHIMPVLIALIQYAPSEAVRLLSSTLSYQPPRLIAELLNHEQNDLSDALVVALKQAYADQNASWQEKLADNLVTLYQAPQSMAREAASGHIDLKRTWIYPFIMRPNELTKDVFHLEQMLNEPDDFVTGSSITTWFYHKDNNISHVIIAGHANGPICREVSAKVTNTILDMKDLDPDDVIVVTGAGFIRSRNKQSKNDSGQTNPLLAGAGDPLFKLQQELTLFEQQVGLVRVKNVDIQHDYDEQCMYIRQSIIEQLHNNEPVFLQSGEQTPPNAVLLPFYKLNDPQFAPLSFELTYEVMGGKDFEELLNTHLREIRLELVHDARRRRDVYVEWLTQDEKSLLQLIFQMVGALAPGVSPRQLERIVAAYHRIIKGDKPIIQPQWQWDRDWSSHSIPGHERTQRFVNFVRSQLRISTSSIDSTSEPDETLLKGLTDIQERKFPVRGRRNFDDATVSDTNEEGILVSLQELVEWRLPNMIGQDNEWIKRMDEFLHKFDENDPRYEGKRIDSISVAVFIDSFLRGWPPVFIESGAVRELYENWSAKIREKVWRHIHENLKQRRIDMTPLQSNNVVFSVQRKRKEVHKKHKKEELDYFLVTPYYLTSLDNLSIFISSHYGIPSYLNLWQHRKTIEIMRPNDFISNRVWAETVCHSGWNALQSNKIPDALRDFKQALRIHPVFASEYLIKQFWETTTQNMNTQLNKTTDLSRAVHNFNDNVIGHSRTLREFIDSNPNFLADPYMLLAYADEYKGEAIEKLKKEIEKLQAEVDALLEALKTDGVLQPGQEKGSYQLNTFSNEARLYLLAKTVEEGNAEVLSIEDAYLISSQIFSYVERNPYLLKNKLFQQGFELVRNIQAKANESKASIDKLIRELLHEQALFETGISGQYTLNPTHPDVITYSLEKRQIDNPFGELNDPVFQGLLAGMYGEVRGKSRLSTLDTLQKNLPELQKQLTQAHVVLWSRLGPEIFDVVNLIMPDRFSQLDKLRKKIELTREKTNNERQAIWDYLYNNPNDWIEKAQAIDSDYVAKVFEFKDHLLIFSQNFRKHVLPLWSIADASKYLRVQSEINKQIRSGNNDSHLDRLKSATETERKHALMSIIEIISKIMLGSNLEQRDYERLDNLRTHLQSFNIIDYMACQNICGAIDSVQGYFIKEATRIYREAHIVQEFPEMRRFLSVCLRLQGLYLASLKSMMGLSQAPVICSFVDSTFKIVNSEYSLLKAVEIDEEKQCIQATLVDGTSLPLISYDNVLSENISHLIREFAQPEFISRVDETNLVPAYAILYMPIASIPLNKRWNAVFSELEPWLIRTIAYTGAMLDDLESDVHEMLLRNFDNTRVIEKVQLDVAAIRDEFLRPFGRECEIKTIMFVGDSPSI